MIDTVEMVRCTNFFFFKGLWYVKPNMDGDQLHHKLVEDNTHFHRNILFLPTDDLKWPSFLDNSATMTRKQVQTLNHRRRASQNLSYLCWILNPSKSTSKQAASDSDSSSDSPSSSSPEEGNQRQLTGPFILNQVTKIAHLTKTKEGKMLPSCGAKFLMRNCTEYRAKFPKTLIFASIRDVCANDLGKKSRCIPFVGPGALRNESVYGCVRMIQLIPGKE